MNTTPATLAQTPTALLDILRELPSLQLPPRGDLTVEAWLAVCQPVVPRETWVRLAMAAL